MCGRFAVTTDPKLLAEKIQAIDEATSAQKDAAGPNYNVAPTTTISTVVRRHSEPDDEPRRRVRLMRWGLVPAWVKTAKGGGPDTTGPLLINARADKVTSSPAFRNSAKSKRCLIPMDGWYEWRPNSFPPSLRSPGGFLPSLRSPQGFLPSLRSPGGETASGKKAPKTPFYMYAADGGLLFMAGLWTTWRPKDASKDVAPLLSCTIITTDAAGPLAEIHDRMPLTISQSDWDRWLDPDAPIDEGLLRGHGDLDRIKIREVSRLVNNVRNNGPELIEPAEPPGRQATLL